MSEIVHPYAQEIAEGSVPAPPPFPKDGNQDQEDATDESVRSIVGRIWDYVSILGPISDVSLIARLGLSALASPVKEYALFHPEVSTRNTKPWELRAQRWYGEQRIAQCLARGWVLRNDDGLLVKGICPPTHTPLSGVGGQSGLTAITIGMDPAKAMELLRAKSDPARMKPVKERRQELKKSISEVGLLDPHLRRWRPGADEEFIINGRTRLEVLEELRAEGGLAFFEEHFPEKVTPIWVEIPADTPVIEVLNMRIQHELLGATKDISMEGRNAYIATLHAKGVKPGDIASSVGRSRQRVQQVLSALQGDLHRGQPHPTEDDVTEWKKLSDAGWTYRRISGRTQWGKSTIQKYVERLREAEAAGETRTVEELGQRSEAEVNEIMTEAFGENRKNWQVSTDAGRRKKAEEIAPIVEAAKKQGVAPKSAVKSKRSMPSFSVLLESDAKTIALAAGKSPVQLAVLESWIAQGWSDLPLDEIKRRLTPPEERPSLELVM